MDFDDPKVYGDTFISDGLVLCSAMVLVCCYLVRRGPPVLCALVPAGNVCNSDTSWGSTLGLRPLWASLQLLEFCSKICNKLTLEYWYS